MPDPLARKRSRDATRRRKPDEGVNEQGLRAVVAMVELCPQRWNQWSFRGERAGQVTYCLAGWTCHLAGYSVRALLKDYPLGHQVIARATSLLNLTGAEARELFYFCDELAEHPTVTELKEKITDLLGVDFRQKVAA